MDLTPKQQTSEAIRQAETILVTTGQHPTIDQIAAVVGLAAILRKFGKKVSAVISDSVPGSVQMLDIKTIDRSLGGLRDFVLKLDVTKAEVDKLRYEVIDGKLNIFVTPFKGGFAPSDVTFDYGSYNFNYDLAVVLGVPSKSRIDRVYDQNRSLFESIPLVNLDFHRSNENYAAVNLIEPNASSLCEMLVALSESLQSGIIDAEIATALLMGIMASTDRFTATHTTSKSLTVAAQMMAAGAKQQAVVRALYRDGKPEGAGHGSERPAAPAAAPREATPRRDTTPPPRREPEPVEEPVHIEHTPEGEVPIIAPSHIEFVEPAYSPDRPAQAPVQAPAAFPHEPNLQPMADFDAALEMLEQRRDRESSSDQNA